MGDGRRRRSVLRPLNRLGDKFARSFNEFFRKLLVVTRDFLPFETLTSVLRLGNFIEANRPLCISPSLPIPHFQSLYH